MEGLTHAMPFLDEWRKGITEDEYRRMYWQSYQTWSRNAKRWSLKSGLGGTYTMRAIVWYQHVYNPGSTDSRYAIIKKALELVVKL